MKRATITIQDDLETVLDSYLKSQEVPPTLTALVQAALGEFLARRGAAPPANPLRITPAKSRLFQLSCAARSVLTFFALIVSISFLKERKLGRATFWPAHYAEGPLGGFACGNFVGG